MSPAPGSHLLLPSYSKRALFAQIQRTHFCLPPLLGLHLNKRLSDERGTEENDLQ